MQMTVYVFLGRNGKIQIPCRIETQEQEDWAIETIDLRVDYGETNAVRGLNLKVPRGEVYGLVGPNGAGKTSTFKILATLMEPTYGEVRLCGIDALLYPQEVRHRIAYMPDLAPLPSDLKCGEFLEMFASAYGLRGKAKRERIDECLEATQMTEKRTAYCKTLSRGMTQRLVLAKSLLHDPELMILDEPASGMDPVARADLRRALRVIADAGRTVIVSSHILSELADMCTSVGLMKKGKMIASGSVADVVSQMSRPQRRISVRLVNKTEIAEKLLRETNHVSEITADPIAKTIRFDFEGNEEEQSQLISDLISGGSKIRSFEEQQSTIEDIFIEMSEPNKMSDE